MATPKERVKVLFDGADMKIENVHVQIVSAINEHIALQMTGAVQAGIYDEYVKKAKGTTKITVKHSIDGNTTLHYEGIIIYICAKAEWAAEELGVYFITLHALSHTYLLDIKKLYQSFQNKDMLYDALLTKLLADFEGADFINNAAKGETLNMFVLQYLDTIWEFLQREASKFEEGLYADATLPAPKFQFGMPDGRDRGELEEYEYSMTKNLQKYMQMVKNGYENEVSEVDFTDYEIFDAYATDTFSLGDKVSYKNMTLYVITVFSEIKDHKLYNTYKLTTKNGLKMPRLANNDIQGLSIPGKVIDVQDNRLKLHLEIDEEQPVEEAYWFDYATFYATWYGMPEINDMVNLHFPNENEVYAMGLNSFKQNPSGGYTRNNEVQTPDNTSASGNTGPIDFEKSASDPDVKMLTTMAGRMIELGPDRICILYNDGTYIILFDSDGGAGGIKMYTNKDLTAYAKNEINVHAKGKIHIEAKESISLQSVDSLVSITPSSIDFYAENKRMN